MINMNVIYISNEDLVYKSFYRIISAAVAAAVRDGCAAAVTAVGGGVVADTAVGVVQL